MVYYVGCADAWLVLHVWCVYACPRVAMLHVQCAYPLCRVLLEPPNCSAQQHVLMHGFHPQVRVPM